MSEKLVRRLRSPAMVFYEYTADDGAVIREAADRIEALEAVTEAAAEMVALHERAARGDVAEAVMWDVAVSRLKTALAKARGES